MTPPEAPASRYRWLGKMLYELSAIAVCVVALILAREHRDVPGFVIGLIAGVALALAYIDGVKDGRLRR